MLKKGQLPACPMFFCVKVRKLNCQQLYKRRIIQLSQPHHQNNFSWRSSIKLILPFNHVTASSSVNLSFILVQNEIQPLSYIDSLRNLSYFWQSFNLLHLRYVQIYTSQHFISQYNSPPLKKDVNLLNNKNKSLLSDW